MKTLTPGKPILIALMAAIIVEAFVCLAWLHLQQTREAPPIFIWFHYAGLLLASPLHLRNMAGFLFVAFTGAFQFFVIFWIALSVGRSKKGRPHA